MRKLEDFFFKRELKKFQQKVDDMILQRGGIESAEELFEIIREANQYVADGLSGWSVKKFTSAFSTKNCFAMIDFVCPPKLSDGLIGDLSDGYHKRIEQGRSERYATWWCWRHGIGAVGAVWGKRLLALIGIERAIEFGRKLIGG